MRSIIECWCDSAFLLCLFAFQIKLYENHKQKKKKIACFFRLKLCGVNFHWRHFNISWDNIITWNWCVHRNFAELDCVICQSWHLESRQHTYTQETIVPLFLHIRFTLCAFCIHQCIWRSISFFRITYPMK